MDKREVLDRMIGYPKIVANSSGFGHNLEKYKPLLLLFGIKLEK